MELLNVLALFVAFVAAVILTPFVRAIAVRKGAVAQPKGDRWHKRPTAMMGGVAIVLSTVVAWLVLLPSQNNSTAALVVLGASVFMGIVGYVDDVYHLKPYQKLIGQVIGAAVVIFAGLTLPWTSSAVMNTAITFVWLVGITNAVNLLDNMDGLAAGVAAIAAAFLAINLLLNGQTNEAVMLALLAAALIGFLIYNSNPASIFMGDTGSMFIGFYLASAALLTAHGGRYRSFAVVIAVPVLVLFIPIFDTTLVTIVRKISGRDASKGGRDHTSHRLVALGLSERRAVWLLYALAFGSGLLAVAINRMTDVFAGVATITAFAIALALLGVYLAGVRVYDEQEIHAARERPLISFIVDLSYKRRVFEVSLDLLLIMLAFYVANLLIAPSEIAVLDRFLREVSVVVVVQLVSILALGSYRGIWRYVSIENLIGYTKAVFIGTATSYIALRFLAGVDRLQPSIFILDGIILLGLITSSRLAFRVFGRLLRRPGKTNRRKVLIYGAGDAGELLLRELTNNDKLQLQPVGFLDDDRFKDGRIIHGLRVFSGNGRILDVCKATGAEEILVSSERIAGKRLGDIIELCIQAGIMVRRMQLHLELLTPVEGVQAISHHRRSDAFQPQLPGLRRRDSGAHSRR